MQNWATLYFGAGSTLLTVSDLVLFLLRLVLGGFFVIYRFRWVYDPTAQDRVWFSPARRKRLEDRLCSCGYTGNTYLAGAVALVEIAAGLAVIFGLLTVLAAAGLFIILIFANCCTPVEEIPPMKPVDRLDIVRCYLHLAEPLYLVLTVLLILSGPGRWSLDYLLAVYWFPHLVPH